MLPCDFDQRKKLLMVYEKRERDSCPHKRKCGTAGKYLLADESIMKIIRVKSEAVGRGRKAKLR